MCASFCSLVLGKTYSLHRMKLVNKMAMIEGSGMSKICEIGSYGTEKKR